MITVSSQSGDTTGTLWEAVTSVSGLSSDSEVSFVIAGFEDPSGNPMSSTNTSFVDSTSDSSRIRMDVTDPHVTSAKLIASDSSLNRDIDRPGYQLALADETITLRFETSERVETPSSLTINGQSGITVSSQSGDTTGMKWEAVTSVTGLSSDSEVSFVIEGFEDPSGNLDG